MKTSVGAGAACEILHNTFSPVTVYLHAEMGEGEVDKTGSIAFALGRWTANNVLD